MGNIQIILVFVIMLLVLACGFAMLDCFMSPSATRTTATADVVPNVARIPKVARIDPIPERHCSAYTISDIKDNQFFVVRVRVNC